MDQARTLRRLAHVARQNPQTAPLLTTPNGLPIPQGVKVLSFTSGKGGVGKTHVVVNLAYTLQRLGYRVLILDADMGLANVDVLLGLTPRFTIQHVLTGEKTLAEILLPGPAGMMILPASSGVQEMAELSEAQRARVLVGLDALEQEIDFLLIDTGAGISTNVTYFNVAAQEIVVVVNPEPTSITDAYALMKVLSTQYNEKNFHILVNSATNATEAKEAFRRLSMVAERFLQVSLQYLGFILYDNSFSQAAKQQKSLMELYPSSASAQCFRRLAHSVLNSPAMATLKGNIRFFWNQLVARDA